MAATISTATAIAPLRLSPAGGGARAAVRSCLHFGHFARPSARPQSRRAAVVDPLAGPSSSGRGSVRCRGAVRTIGESEFGEEVLGSELPVLAEFVAEWCGPCRLISPIIDWASEEYKGRLKIVKIDHDANPQLIEEYKVYGLPCLILFSNGKAVPESQREGAITKAKLKEYLDSLLNPTTVV